jgi:hypothetical protein
MTMHARNKLFSRLAPTLALAAALASGMAQAGPTYHVAIDSHGYSGPGSLDLSFLGLANAAPATATVNHFTGAFGADGVLDGAVSGVFPGGLVFDNGGPNYFWQGITLGGAFGFDVGFDLPDGTGAGTTFAVYLTDLASYLTNGPVVTIDLASGAAPAIAADASLAAVTPVAPAGEVPEPAGWALMLAGLGIAPGLLGWQRRRSTGKRQADLTIQE